MHSSRTVFRTAFERTLTAAGWEETRLAALRVTGRCGPMQEAVAAGSWPSPYAFTPWDGIDPDDREAIERLSGQPSCRDCPALTPPMWPAVIEPATSFAIRRHRRLVGWVISERQPAPEGSAIHYAAAYVDTALWGTGLMITACCHAFARPAAVRKRPACPVRDVGGPCPG
jgi:hypothetical protein